MPTTVNYLSSANSLVRFPIGSSINQTADYLNNSGSPLHSWSATNATLTVVNNLVKLPSCNSLLITPRSSLEVVISLSDTTVDGSLRAQRAPLNYMFHCLMLSQEPATSNVILSSKYQSETGKTSTISRDTLDANAGTTYITASESLS